MEICDQFNNLIIEFIDKLMEQFPEQKKLKTYKKNIDLSKTVSNDMPAQIFFYYCLDYENYIMERDETFFKKQDNIINSIDKTYQPLSSQMGIIDFWDSINEGTKVSIWEYFTILFIISKKHDETIENNSVKKQLLINFLKNFS